MKAVDTASLMRVVKAVAFDQYVIDARGLQRGDGAVVLRGTGSDGTVLAVAAVPWPEMPVDWVAMQSRRAPDLLGLAGDEMEPVGHRNFDDRFAVDADDVSEFRRVFRTSLRDWFVSFDDDHGPLVVVFEAPEPAVPVPRRRATDPPPEDPPDDDDPLVFLARLVTDDDAVVETLTVASELVEHVRANARQ